MDATGRRRSIQSAASTPRDAEGAHHVAPATVESEGSSFRGCEPVTVHCESAVPPLPLSAAPQQVGTAPAGRKVLAQVAMVRIIVRFLTARELLAFSRTARNHCQGVAAELSERSVCLDTQYTRLFDEYRSLKSQFAVVSAGRPPVDQLRAIRDRVKALGKEMDDKLQAWDEIQQAWGGAGITQPKPVLARDEGYLD